MITIKNSIHNTFYVKSNILTLVNSELSMGQVAHGTLALFSIDSSKDNNFIYKTILKKFTLFYFVECFLLFYFF